MIATAVQLAIRNLLSHKPRTFAAGAGICIAVFLMFLQWGLLQAVRTEATALYDFFEFDLAITSQDYQLLYSPGEFDRVRMLQTLALDSVDSSFNLNIDSGRWIDMSSWLRSSVLIFGVDEDPGFIANTDMQTDLGKMMGSRAIMVDRHSHSDFGSIEQGNTAQIDNREVDIYGQFSLGLFFYAEGSVLVKNDVFYNLTGNDSRDTNVGLIKLKPGKKPTVERARLKDLLPDDVIVLTRRELIAQEQNYFVSIKPLGLIFQAGMFIAFFTGVVVLFQIISTEIGTRMHEYATIKAMGFSVLFVYGVAVTQILILSLLAFLPAVVLSHYFFQLIVELTHLPVEISQTLFAQILMLTLLMGFVSGAICLHKLSRADPAELY